MKRLLVIILFVSAHFVAGPVASYAQDSEQKRVLFQNVNIFDGKNERLTEGMNVLVENNKIAKIAKSIPAPSDATVIDGGGRTLMPGLIDAHWHTMYSMIPIKILLNSDIGYINLVAARGAEETLMRGFTTVRDIGGPSFAVKKVIDQGLYNGPRIYSSGAPISQTSGHFDFRGPNDVPANASDPLDYFQRVGFVMVADGVIYKNKLR